MPHEHGARLKSAAASERSLLIVLTHDVRKLLGGSRVGDTENLSAIFVFEVLQYERRPVVDDNTYSKSWVGRFKGFVGSPLELLELSFYQLLRRKAVSPSVGRSQTFRKKMFLGWKLRDLFSQLLSFVFPPEVTKLLEGASEKKALKIFGFNKTN